MPCLERIDEQWEPLLQYMTSQEESTENSFRGKRLLRTLRQPHMRIYIRFLIHAMKLSSSFMKKFQESSVLIHKLHNGLVELLQRIATQFIKVEVLKESESVWKIQFKERRNQVAGKDMLVGESTLMQLNDPTEAMLLLKVDRYN